MTFFLTLVSLFLIGYIIVNRKKYQKEIDFLQTVVNDLNDDLFRHKGDNFTKNNEITQLKDKLFVKEREITGLKLKVETLTEINDKLNLGKNKQTATEQEVCKNEEKPKTKKPYFRKKKKSNDN
jgi:predicted  nucleic acid-binding Zn-ribbon protein